MPARQVGRSLPRLEARAKVTGRAEYIHNLRLPGMLLRQDLPQHDRRMAASSAIDAAAARAFDGVYRGRHRRRRPQGHSAALLRAGVSRSADPGDRQGAPRRRAGGGGARARSACRRSRRRGLIVVEYDELPAVFDEVEAATSDGDRARRAQAGRHVSRPQASRRASKRYQRRARLPPAPRRRRAGFRRGRPRLRAHVPHPAGHAHAARAVRLASPRRATGR